LIIEPDKENKKKDIEKLDIELPILTPRIYKEYKKLELIDIYSLKNNRVRIKQYNKEQLHEIIFTDLDGVFSHKIDFKGAEIDYRNVVAFFTNSILKESRLFSGFEVLYPKVRDFIKYRLFEKEVELEDKNILRNLSDASPKRIIFETFRDAISKLTVSDAGSAEIKRFIKLREVKPSVFRYQTHFYPNKSVFNIMVGDSDFEVGFAHFLDTCEDIISFAKNIQSTYFKIEYQAEDGNIKNYYPDFIVKKDIKTIYIIETKGREDLDDIRKINRLKLWCNDVNDSKKEKVKYIPLYIKEEKWNKYKKNLTRFQDIIGISENLK